jgi:hypothetical protein
VGASLLVVLGLDLLLRRFADRGRGTARSGSPTVAGAD